MSLINFNPDIKSIFVFQNIFFRVQNRMRIIELKHEMANIHVTKLQSQLKASIKVSR